jgi:hypothetical protein
VRVDLRIKGLTTGIVVAALALGLLLLPGTAAAGGDGPIATKSGALVNYVSTGKLKIAKKITILVVCSANCNVDTITVVKGPRFKQRANVSGPLPAGVPGGPFFKPNGQLLREMKAQPGKFRVNSTVTATDPATGATETIARSFRLKRKAR